MTTFALRLLPPRPTFAADMTDDERALMGQHAAHWQPLLAVGKMVVFGPFTTESSSYGLAVVDTEDEDELRAFADRDPVAVAGLCTFEIARMLAGFVRPA